MEHEHKPDDPLDYNYIEDGIFAGTNQCCKSELSRVLKNEGITADISLEDVRMDHPFGVEMYTWIPVADRTPPTQDQLHYGVRSLQELVRQKRKVYVHCKNGHGRTTTLLCAYFMSKGRSFEEAFALIKSKRPGAHLQDAQIEALKNLDIENLR